MSANENISELQTELNDLTISLTRLRMVSALREIFEPGLIASEVKLNEELAERWKYTEDEVQVVPHEKRVSETLTLDEDGETLPEIPIVRAENEKLREAIGKTLDSVLDKVNQRDDAGLMNELHTILFGFEKKLKNFNAELPVDIPILELIE